MAWLLFKPPYVDARGRKVQLFDPFTAEADELEQDELERLRRRVRTARWRLLGNFLLSCALSVAAIVYFESIDLPIAPRVRYILYGLLLIPWAVAYTHTAMHCTAYDLKLSMLKMQRCPSCALAISNVPAGADEKTECPRCGSVWRVPLTGWKPTVRDGRGCAVRLFDPEVAQLSGRGEV